MVEATVAFRSQERVFVQPGGGGEDLRLGNYGIAVAVPATDPGARKPDNETDAR